MAIANAWRKEFQAGCSFWYNDITGESTIDIPSDSLEKAVNAKKIMLKKTLKHHQEEEEEVSHGTGAQVYNGRDFEDFMAELER